MYLIYRQTNIQTDIHKKTDKHTDMNKLRQTNIQTDRHNEANQNTN